MNNERTRNRRRIPEIIGRIIRKAAGGKLLEDIPIDLSCTPVLKQDELLNGVQTVLAVPLVWDSNKEMYVLDKPQGVKALTVNRQRTPYATPISTPLVANVWTLVCPANPRRIAVILNGSNTTTTYSLSTSPTGLGNWDVDPATSFTMDYYTGNIYMKTTVTHAAEVTEFYI